MSIDISNQELTNIYQCYRPKAVALLRRKYRLQECDAFDIADQTFIEAFYGNGRKFDPVKAGNGVAWLLRKANHRALDFLRSTKRRDRLHNEASAAGNGHPMDPDRLYRRKLQETNRRALFDKLPEESKKLWNLLRQYPPAEVARLLSMTLETVQRNQEKLKRQIKRIASELNLQPGELYGA